MTYRYQGLRAMPLVVAALLALALPLAASAHSEFVSASPANGSTVIGTPPEIVLTFSAALNPTKSSIILRDSSGGQVAKAGVDTTNAKVMRLTPPSLAPGAYEIDWTSVSLDGDLLRGKVMFAVTAPTPSPTIAPTATASAAPSATPSATASPVPTPSPAASAASAPASTSAADVILPVLVAIVLIAVLGATLLRRRSGARPR